MRIHLPPRIVLSPPPWGPAPWPAAARCAVAADRRLRLGWARVQALAAAEAPSPARSGL